MSEKMTSQGKPPGSIAARMVGILNLLPRTQKDAISTPDLFKRITDAGFTIEKRTLERHLQKLHDLPEFKHLNCATDGKTNRWWLDKPMSELMLPHETALSLMMLIDHARPLCAKILLEDLEHLYQHAKLIVEKGYKDSVGDWAKKFVSNSRFQQLLPAQVAPEVLTNLKDAVVTNRKARVLYHSRSSNRDQEVVINPLGMSFQDGNLYLACTFDGDAKRVVRALPLQRFKRVDPPRGAEYADTPVGFDMRTVVKGKSFITSEDAPPVTLRLRLDKSMFERLSENALSKEQVLEPGTGGGGTLECSITESQGLKLWILAQGDSVEVLAPQALRDEIGQKAQRMAALYQG